MHPTALPTYPTHSTYLTYLLPYSLTPLPPPFLNPFPPVISRLKVEHPYSSRASSRAHFLFGILALLIIGYSVGSVRIINQGTEALVERLGRYHRKLKPGLNFIVPLLDYIVLKDSVREQILDVEKQAAITRDNVATGCGCGGVLAHFGIGVNLLRH